MGYGRFMMDKQVAYEQGAKASVISPGGGQQLRLYSIHMQNRSGQVQDMGAYISLGSLGYAFGLINPPAVFNDVTAALQGGSPQNIFTTSVGSGFCIQSKNPFNLIGLTLSQAQTGAPTYNFQYFNGSAYVALPDVVATPAFNVTGDTLFVFSTPRDWVPGTTGAVGADASQYSILVTCSVAPGQNVIATNVWSGKVLHFQAGVADKGNLDIMYSDEYPRVLNGNEGILPFFSVPSAKNLVTVKWFTV